MRFRHFPVVLLALLLTLGAAAAPALATSTGGGHWTWQSPLPHGSTLWSTSWVDAQEGWAVGAANDLLHTTDGGLSWESVETGGDYLYDVFFVDAAQGWACGAWGAMLHTTDGGATWQRQATGTLSQLSRVCFADGQHGWTISEGEILATTDGGATWGRQQGGTPASWYNNSTWTYLSDLAFADPMHGWVAGTREVYRGPNEGSHAIVLRTADGGATWTDVSPDGYAGLAQLSWLSADELWAAGAGNAVAHSSDGGVTWTRQTQTAPVDLVGIAMTDAQHGWAVGSSGAGDWWSDSDVEVGIALHTDDGGASWGPVELPLIETDSPVSVSFSGQADGRIVLRSGMVLATGDGGDTWSLVGPEREAGVAFADVAVEGDEVWAVGSSGTTTNYPATGGVVWRSSDGGATWAAVDDELIAAFPLKTVCVLPGGQVWVGGSAGRILHSVDGGATWTRQPTGMGVTFTALAFSDADHGWAVSRSLVGAVLRTDDGGAHWRVAAVRDDDEATNESRARYFGVTLVGDEHVWLGGMEYRSDCEENGAGMVTRSSDGGATWAIAVAGPRAVQKTSFVSSEVGWALSGSPDWWGGPGAVLKTTDGGATWVEQATVGQNREYSLVDMQFGDEQQGWVLARDEWYGYGDAVLMHTYDGGAHWGLQALGVSNSLTALAFSDDVHGWAVGYGATIIATADGGGIAPVSSDNAGRWGERWTNRTFTVKITTVDDGLGLAPTRSTLDGGEWEDAAVHVIAAPRSHANDGMHVIRYQGVDLAGNHERPKVCVVWVDTVRPTVKAPSSATVRKGRMASLHIKPYDELAGYVRLNIAIQTLAGKVVKRLHGGMTADGEVHYYRFPCRLAKGRYVFVVNAKDMAGNTARTPARNWLTVK